MEIPEEVAAELRAARERGDTEVPIVSWRVLDPDGNVIEEGCGLIELAATTGGPQE